MPLAILEAGASRLPVIATPVGSIPSVLNDNNAYMVTLDSFADTMTEIYRNYPDAQKKAKKLYDQVTQEHIAEKMAKSWKNSMCHFSLL